ncbi:MAG: hypothetical protein QOK29_1201 [Rhodospirillaceae bacterium]|jgi:uncharacterized protein YcbK (DUF882 family)|nr:hypothetical protein [Rhodospirillaceae bacterium]
MDSKSRIGASCSRRFFLGFGLVVAAGSISPAARAALTGPRRLAFYHTHTGEKLSTVYWEKGGYVRGALGEIDYILRDYVNGAERPIDRRLLDMLAELHRRLASRAPFEIISGYRSPETNEKLRARSDGVAKHSYHLNAMAIDIRLPDVPLRTLRQAAMDLGRGGVGIYPRSNFVHVDTGPVRYW